MTEYEDEDKGREGHENFYHHQLFGGGELGELEQRFEREVWQKMRVLSSLSNDKIDSLPEDEFDKLYERAIKALDPKFVEEVNKWQREKESTGPAKPLCEFHGCTERSSGWWEESGRPWTRKYYCHNHFESAKTLQ